jgi:hypothetical protein
MLGGQVVFIVFSDLPGGGPGMDRYQVAVPAAKILPVVFSVNNMKIRGFTENTRIIFLHGFNHLIVQPYS